MDIISEHPTSYKVFLGFDGFIDKIVKPIKIKNDQTAIPFQTMMEFSMYLQEKSGKSCSIELELVQEKIGGNMPIVANALGNLGCEPICLGAFGLPEIHPLFRKMNENCTLVSVTNPGTCDALEFEDGKVMLAINSGIDQLDYQKITHAVPLETLIDYFQGCDAFAFLNWGELIHSNNIWSNFLNHIISQCDFGTKKIMFVDFSDFSKRTSEEVQTMATILEKFSEFFHITISVNENELHLLLEKLYGANIDIPSDEMVVALSKKLQCKNFVIHLLECTKFVKNDQVHAIPKKVIQQPKIITGGGDHFNAGLLYGLLLGLEIEKAIAVGASLSCLYVKNAGNIYVEQLQNELN